MSDDLRADLIEALREVAGASGTHSGKIAFPTFAAMLADLAGMLEVTGRLTWYPETEVPPVPQVPGEGGFLQRIVRSGVDGSGPLECAGCAAILAGVTMHHKPRCPMMESLALIALQGRDAVIENLHQQMRGLIQDGERIKGQRDRLRSELARIGRLARAAEEL